MVLSYKGKEKKFTKVLDNIKVEGKHEFYEIKARKINEPEKTKKIKVTGENMIITFNNNKEIELMNAQDLTGKEYIKTADGLYQIYEINKEFDDDKYNLVVNGRVVYANGIFISTICSNEKEKAKIIKPTLEEWQNYQDNSIELN